MDNASKRRRHAGEDRTLTLWAYVLEHRCDARFMQCQHLATRL